jgi:hypothetical protein
MGQVEMKCILYFPGERCGQWASCFHLLTNKCVGDLDYYYKKMRIEDLANRKTKGRILNDLHKMEIGIPCNELQANIAVYGTYFGISLHH